MAFPQPKPQPPQLPQHLLRTINCQQGAVRAVRFNVDGNYLLSCGSDKSLKLWSVGRGTLLKTYSGHGYEVLDADSSYDNSQLCSCSSDKTVILWDVATGQVTRKLRGHAGKVNCVQFNEEATVILSGSIDGTVRCWDTKSRRNEPIQVLDEARDSISSLKVSQHELLTGSVDGRVRRYDLRMGQYTGHKMKGYKLDCCLSSKDTHVLSCSEDGHVYCWDLVEGSLSLKLPVGKAVVQSLSFHPTETCLLTAMEGHVQVWGAQPEEPQEPQDDTPVSQSG
uniref:WD repeat domain-containing protein 83 n=1 Tax=Poecilia latipinna TaxID=48699 RepID=A0A3B3VPA8_9TELE